MSLTFTEASAQYEALAKTYEEALSKRAEFNAFWERCQGRTLVFLGCGSSYALCKTADLLFASETGRMCVALPAGDVLINASDYERILKNAVVFNFSRSGKTSEVLRAVELVRDRFGCPVCSVICSQDTPLGALSDLSLEIPWSFDHSVCQTRSVSSLYTSILIMAAFAAGNEKLLADLKTMIDQGAAWLGENDALFRKLGALPFENVLMLADGAVRGIAEEAALAFCEVAQIPGTFQQVLDVRHGPMVLVTEKTLALICVSQHETELQKALLRDIRAKGCAMAVLGGGSSFDEAWIAVTQGLHPAVYGLPLVNVAQMVACHAAQARGVDADNPTGLSPWIKL